MRPVALSYFLLVLALACGGLGTTSSVAPVSPTAPTTPTEAADHRPATHAAPAEVEVLPDGKKVRAFARSFVRSFVRSLVRSLFWFVCLLACLPFCLLASSFDGL